MQNEAGYGTLLEVNLKEMQIGEMFAAEENITLVKNAAFPDE